MQPPAGVKANLNASVEADVSRQTSGFLNKKILKIKSIFFYKLPYPGSIKNEETTSKNHLLQSF